MVNYICTRFKDSDGLDLGCHLIPKEYLLEKYPAIQEWVKAPALWVWGPNLNGELGVNDAISRSSPSQTIANGTNWRQINTIGGGSAGIKTDGTLWLWGFGSNGELGNNSVIDRSSPVQTISGGTNWCQISRSFFHTTAIKTDGSLWVWGYGGFGVLGNQSLLSRSSPVQTISGGTNWKKISSASGSIVAIKTDGTLWTWGAGTAGQLGNNNTINRSSPVQTISGGTNWKQVSSGYASNAAIKTDGTLWLWGSNSGINSGILGNENIINRSSPVQTVSGGTNWKEISLSYSAGAIKTDGSLWMWGYNGRGQLGGNDVIRRSSPVQTVSNGTNWKQISTGRLHSAAIKTDGSLWMWGCNLYGILSDNTSIPRSSPVQTISSGTGWRQVRAGNFATVAIRDEGDY